MRKVLERVRLRLVQIYTQEAERTKEEIAQYTAKVKEELNKKPIN